MNTKALREKRKALADEANAILDAAIAEGRAATPDELEKVDRLHDEIDRLKQTIERAERAEAEQRAIVPESQRQTTIEQSVAAPEIEARNRAFRTWYVAGPAALTADDVRALEGLSGTGHELTLHFPSLQESRQRLRGEQRAQSLVGAQGGYTVEREFMRSLEAALTFSGPMLQVGSIFETDTGAPLDWPTYNDTSNKGRILAINTAATVTDVTFGQLTFDAYKYSSDVVLVPVELMQDSAFDLNAVVADVLGERLGRILNEHFTVGTGTNQPNGIVTASTRGKQGTTGQTTSVTYDDLVDLVYSVDRAYRAQNAQFMMHDSTIKAVRKLKDGNQLPIWQPSTQAGEPDRLLGYPVVVNNDMPQMAASAKSIVFGALQKYKIRRVRSITLVRLTERWGDAHQVGFLAFARFDGDLLDAGTNPVKHYANSAT